MFTFSVSWLECNEIRFFNIFRLCVKKKKKKKKTLFLSFKIKNYKCWDAFRMRIEDISATGK